MTKNIMPGGVYRMLERKRHRRMIWERLVQLAISAAMAMAAMLLILAALL